MYLLARADAYALRGPVLVYVSALTTEPKNLRFDCLINNETMKNELQHAPSRVTMIRQY